jgi:DNA-directed RNA polymerase specialized sigma24 family protein
MSHHSHDSVRTLQAEQRALLQRIDQIVHWLKHDLHYRGSKDTADLAGIVAEKLVRRDTYRRVISTRPKELWGLLRRVARHAIIDVIRAQAAAQLPTIEPMQNAARTPSLHTELQRRTDLLAIRQELGRFRAGDGYARVGDAAARSSMATAFELHYFEGESHAQIANTLGTSKATVGNWLEFMRLQIARRIAERERLCEHAVKR